MVKKNKRGDIPVTILVIGIFGVCTFALIMFLNSSNSYSDKYFSGVALIEEANAQIEAVNAGVLHIVGTMSNFGIISDENGQHFSFYKTKREFEPGIDENGLHLFQEKVVFSVEFNP